MASSPDADRVERLLEQLNRELTRNTEQLRQLNERLDGIVQLAQSLPTMGGGFLRAVLGLVGQPRKR